MVILKTRKPFIAPFVLCALSGFFLTGCGLEGVGLGLRPAEPQTHSMDGVKWITPEIREGSDARGFLQSSYTVSPTERLLIRFEGLASKSSAISLSGDRKVSVSISVDTGEDLRAAASTLRLCPVTKNWMMLATWERAYPMGSSGEWSRDGGDFDEGGCVAASASPARNAAVEMRTLSFDVTPWVINDVRGRGLNYGLILITHSGTPVRVRGDRDAAHSPRISWMQN